MDQDERRELTRSTLAALLSHGDNPKKERPVSHWIYFSSETERDAFKAQPTLQGFTVRDLDADGDDVDDNDDDDGGEDDGEDEDEDEEDEDEEDEDEEDDDADEGPFGLEVAKTEALDSVARTADMLAALAEPFGGDYDGWESPVTR